MITDYFMITEKSNRLKVIMITDYDYPNSALYSLINTGLIQETSGHDSTMLTGT